MNSLKCPDSKCDGAMSLAKADPMLNLVRYRCSGCGEEVRTARTKTTASITEIDGEKEVGKTHYKENQDVRP